MLKVTGDDPKSPGVVTRLCAAAAGAFCCAYFSLPFDMIKSRLQDMKARPDGTMPYNGVVHCGSSIVRKEGVFALWTGHAAYAGRCVPHAMILLMVLDPVRDMYK